MRCKVARFKIQDSKIQIFFQQKNNCWGTIVIVIETLQTYGPHTTNLQTSAENIHKTKLDEHKENIVLNNKLPI